MPTVSISHQDLICKIGNLSQSEVENLCWRYGLELDEVTSEFEIVLKEQGAEKAAGCSKEVIYKIDVPANRYDLLCVEGLTRALMVFEEKISSPTYTLKPQTTNIVLNIDPATAKVRPFVVAAVLRNVKFDQSNYKSFIQLQEKLHQNIGKRRYIVSIGTHDLDTIKPPFLYTARKPSDIKFKPLNETKEFTAEELMHHYSRESHLKPYLSIIRDFDEYPAIYDSDGVVLSFPPIVNGNHSKIHLETKNVLIEITGTNLHKISVSLDTMVTMFSEYCADKFTIEPVEVRRTDGSVHQYPELSYRLENVSVDYINKTVGTSFSGDEVAKLLDRMCLSTEIIKGSNGSVLSVKVPPTRHDVIHRCDIAEDVAISYGYDNIPEPKTVGSSTMGGDTALNRFSDSIRFIVVCQGFTECLSFALCSREDISSKLGKDLNCVPAVHISQPKTLEFQVARTTLLPGILNTLQSNQHLPLPLRLFEVQDVVLLNPSKDVGAGNCRRLCAVHYGSEPDFDTMFNVMTTVMTSCDYQCKKDTDISSCLRYEVEEVEDSALMPGRSFRILIGDRRDIGRIGILKVSVLKKFGLKKGLASMIEIDIEPLVERVLV